MNINPPSDPVIKKRVSITGDTSPVKWTIISGLCVVSLVGAIYYFYPNLFQKVDDSTQVYAGYEYESSEITQSLAFADKETTSTPLEIVPAITETSNRSVPKTDDISVPIEKSKPVDTKIPATVPTKSIVATTELTATESTTVPAAEPTTVPESSPKPIDQVERLLTKANRQIARERFTSPKGDNAYETYQELSQLEPQSAQRVLDGIVAWYFKLGQKYINRDRFTQPKYGNAHAMYQKLLDIAPKHNSTQALFNEMSGTLEQRAVQYLQEDKVTTPKGKNAYTIYQQMLTVIPQSEKAQGILESILQRLLTRANRQMSKQSYTTPKDDNAVDTYRQILKISPNHVEAQNGLNEIANRYYKLATIKKGQARYKDSMTWIKKGLQVQPDHPALNQLRREVLEKL